MSEKDGIDNEEYHFVDDPQMMAPEPEFKAEPESGQVDPSKVKPALNTKQGIAHYFEVFVDRLQKNSKLRLALIVGFAIILLLMLYRCSSSHPEISANQAHLRQQMHPVQSIRTLESTQPQHTNSLPSARSDEMDAMTNQKLSELSSTQSTLQAQVQDFSGQLSTVNGNLNQIEANLKQLSEQLSQLAVTVQEQAKVSAILETELKQHQIKQRVSHPLVKRQSAPYYLYLQALIPGRAWLSDSKGDTFTVREGSNVGSYGVIRYIDAKRGRLLTSSGRIIKFKPNET